MNSRDVQRELNKRQKLRQLEALESNESRAQSIAIGNAGGGQTEITMRSAMGKFLWNVYQPVEVVELINQLAANIGCHIHIKPREDFASWRTWKELSLEQKKHYGSFPPFPNEFLDDGKCGATLPHPEEKIGMEKKLPLKEQENVATKKAVNKRNTKRSRSSSK